MGISFDVSAAAWAFSSLRPSFPKVVGWNPFSNSHCQPLGLGIYEPTFLGINLGLCLGGLGDFCRLRIIFNIGVEECRPVMDGAGHHLLQFRRKRW